MNNPIKMDDVEVCPHLRTPPGRPFREDPTQSKELFGLCHLVRQHAEAEMHRVVRVVLLERTERTSDSQVDRSVRVHLTDPQVQCASPSVVSWFIETP